MDQKLAEDLQTRFTYHAPKASQPERYQVIRDNALDLAQIMVIHCPESRELSLAITKLEEAVMWANSAIARRE